MTTLNNTLKCVKNNCSATNCDLCDTSGICVKCSNYMTLNDTSCINTCTIPKCLSCKPNHWFCAQCFDGNSFNYMRKVCQDFSVVDCAVHLFGDCLECKNGYYFNQDRTACLQKCDTWNCTVCLRSDTTVCTKCQPGYNLTIVNDETVCRPFLCGIVDCLGCN